MKKTKCVFNGQIKHHVICLAQNPWTIGRSVLMHRTLTYMCSTDWEEFAYTVDIVFILNREFFGYYKLMIARAHIFFPENKAKGQICSMGGGWGWDNSNNWLFKYLTRISIEYPNSWLYDDQQIADEQIHWNNSHIDYNDYNSSRKTCISSKDLGTFRRRKMPCWNFHFV